MTKLRRILLVDDNPADNFIHEMVIEEVGCAEEIITKLDGMEALEYLTTAVDGNYPQPELICLDINMPRMNGWEFLEEYAKLPEAQKGKIVLMMLTTSMNPDDMDKAKNVYRVPEYTTKPLAADSLRGVLERYFA